ncbi:MAG: SUMF1/EgtB/PvdO family nonheme iron enzyme [Cyanobacteriota bacterium]
MSAGRVAQLLRGGSWFNHPRNCRSAYRNRRHQDNRNDNVGFRLCVFPPAPFIVRAVGRDSSGSTRRVQTRSCDRLADPHIPGPLPPGSNPGSWWSFCVGCSWGWEF